MREASAALKAYSLDIQKQQLAIVVLGNKKDWPRFELEDKLRVLISTERVCEP